MVMVMAIRAGAITAQAAYYKINRSGLAQKVNPFFLKEKEMFAGYYYPFYRGFANPYQSWSYPSYGGYGGYGGYGFNNNYGTSVIGSAIANQNMNVIGTGAIGGTQTATPTVIW